MLGTYDSNEFDTIVMWTCYGVVSGPVSDSRSGYYRMGPIPHLLFNGGNDMVGAGTNAIDGSVYDPVVKFIIGTPTPVQMSISSFSLTDPGAQITVDVALEGDLANPTRTKLRVAVVEDGLTSGATPYENILRDMLPDQALTIALDGESEQLTLEFDPDVAWDVAHLRLIAFVQDDTNREILQSCNTRPTPDYSLRYYHTGPRTKVGLGVVEFGQSGLFNAGAMTDTYDLTLDTSSLPAGWSSSFAYDGSDYTSLSLELAPGARALFNVSIDAAGTGEGEVTLNLHSQSGLTDDREFVLKVITGDRDILLVDDDGSEILESRYIGPAITAMGKTHVTWDRTTGVPTADVMSNFDVVVWECGWNFPTVDADDRAALSEYLDGGGNLFITGQDIGWELYDEGGAAQIWYNNYLHANYIADDSGLLTLEGVPGDPIGDGLSLAISGGDGANNQDYPSDIDPRDASASTILTYNAQANGGIKVDTGTYRLVYLAFGFEAIDNAADRSLLMQRIIDWLVPGGSAAGDGLPGVLALHDNVPNPFNPMTKIRFSVATKSQVTLGIYDVKGRLVRVLSEGPRGAGEHTVTWDGRDGSGRALPSGNYFARIEAGDQVESKKMMLVR